MKKALITGVTGQDGSYLAELLLNKGYEVYGLDRRKSVGGTENIENILTNENFKIVEGDMLKESRLNALIKTIRPDEVYHLASQSFVKVSWDVPVYTCNVNAMGTIRLLEAVRICFPATRFYHASTSEMFGLEEGRPQDEMTYHYPRSPYACSKSFGHNITRNYRESYNLFCCNGICFNHECLSENTPIIVREKNTKIITIKRIKDIRKAKEKGRNVQQWSLSNIEIWDGDKFVALNFLTATRRKKNEDFHCKLINTRHGIIEVTNHHNMLDKSGRKVKAQEVKNGSELLHKDFPDGKAISILSNDEAFFLGMIVGDGYINNDGRANFCNNNKKIMERFRKLWMKVGLGTIRCETYTTEYGKTTRAILKGNSNYLRSLRSKIYSSDAFKKIPDKILNAKKDLQLAFLEGYNCTDGLKSNPCIYKFKNFKTNLALLAQGLIYLIHQTTGQNYNITFEEDEKYYGYYSINLLTTTDNALKEITVRKLLEQGLGQREIYRKTKISRTFIRKIQMGGEVTKEHPFAKSKIEVKKTLYHTKQPIWVYDLETDSGKFMGGVGNMVVANSPRRGLEFVTRKITHSAAKIKLGLQEKLVLGNLNAKRDWGYAFDYVEAMYMMLQQDKPDDYVIATGQSHSVHEFVEFAFNEVGIGIRWKGDGVNETGIYNNKVIVEVSKDFYRPVDVNILGGDSSKAKKILGWEPKTSFEDMIKIMVKHDMELLKKEI